MPRHAIKTHQAIRKKNRKQDETLVVRGRSLMLKMQKKHYKV